MMKKNIMNGKMPGINDNYGLRVGIGSRYMDEYMKATTDKKVTVTRDFERCYLTWESFEGADRYRVDLFSPSEQGPNMGTVNYICTETTWTTETKHTTGILEPATSKIGIVFAYKGEECIARYPSFFCIVEPRVVGDMLADAEDDFTSKTVILDGKKTVKFSPLSAEKSVLLNKNPERGFRSEEDYFVPLVEDIPDWSDEEYYADAKRRLERNVYWETVTVSRVYFILDKYVNEPVLPDKVLEYMQGYYNAYRRLGVKLYLGHYYQHGCHQETVSEEVVLSHLKQLTPIFEKNADVVYLFSMNFIGCYGEWTCMHKELDYQKFVNALFDAAPSHLRLVMRQPIYKQRFVNSEYERYYRIGFANEALHGLKYSHIDIGQSWVQPGSHWWDVTMKEGAYTINDAEPFTTRWIRLVGTWSSGLTNIEALSQQRTCTMSIQHAYGDICQFGGEITETQAYSWKGQEICEADLDRLGIAYSPSWFITTEGDKIKRNCFEFLRDHLGYRITAKNMTINEENGELSVSLNLKNIGFSAAFNLRSGFVILDKEGNIVRDISAGNPEEWYCTDPANYRNREYLIHNVSAKIPLGDIKGEYSIGFYMTNSLSQFARMDNTVEFKNGYHILANIKK